MLNRASICNSCRLIQRFKHASLTYSFVRRASYLSNIHTDLTSRCLPTLRDNCSPLPSYLLLTTLADFLPLSTLEPLNFNLETSLPFAHHLIYFPPPTPLSSLLPDGTDPLHSPGAPFNHRMWAGGAIRCRDFKNGVIMGAGEVRCVERIRDVTIRGPAGDEKVYVQIERRFDKNSPKYRTDKSGTAARDEHTDFIEIRNLVFLRDKVPKVFADASHLSTRVIKPPHPPDISYKLIPTPALLFRFSALTFNAHAIHLDKQYCREIEGHRNLLVHGPLSLLLMVEFLKAHLADIDAKNDELCPQQTLIEEIEYRNLAPLYAEEEMRVCARNSKKDDWELWIEGGNGGLAVRALAKTRVV